MPRFICYFVLLAGLSTTSIGQEAGFDVTLRTRAVDQAGRLAVRHQPQTWDAGKTAIIVCDMWDAHHCLNAVRRVGELAPRINQFLIQARERGATIVHAPSSCTEFYKDHPARQHVASIPKASNAPIDIGAWCDWKNEDEEHTGYPIDHSDGGEDDDLEEHARWAEQLQSRGRNPGSPWIRQVESIEIDDEDFITDDGVENWSILEHRGIDNVMLVGVHTNMCVLGRPFGLRQLSKNGKNVVLVRDLTDTMYNPAMRPYVSHFSGTDLIVKHIEEHVCPTISSNQVLGGPEFRFRNDKRPHVVMVIGEQEYETARSLPVFAKQHLYKHMKVTYVTADEDDINDFPGIQAVRDADLLVVSVRRRTPPRGQLEIIREYVASGRPVVGIRTASHAFSLRDDQQPPAGHDAWPEFDAEVLGGNYQGHHGNKPDGDVSTFVWSVAEGDQARQWPMLAVNTVKTTSWLYKTLPLRPGANVLMMGRVGARKPHEPVTWTYIHAGGGRTFYTSLGHPDEFATESFQQLLRAGMEWALRMPSS
jgi:type 1 glutamine amidotransferase/nicotinamidase-related amidase